MMNRIAISGDLKAVVTRLKRNDSALTYLDLSNKSLSNREISELADGLRNNTVLVSLNLSSNKVGDAGVQALANALQSNKKLSCLTLDNITLSDESVEKLSEMLAKNVVLTKLSLINDQITVKGAAAIANALLLNQSVIEIYLGNNQIDDQGAEALIEVLQKNKTVKGIHIAGNNISESSIQKLKNLTEKDRIVTDKLSGATAKHSNVSNQDSEKTAAEEDMTSVSTAKSLAQQLDITSLHTTNNREKSVRSKDQNVEGGQTTLNRVSTYTDADKKNQKNESTAKSYLTAIAKQQQYVTVSERTKQMLPSSKVQSYVVTNQSGTNEKSVNSLTSQVINAEGGQTELNRVNIRSVAASKDQRNESGVKPDVVAAAKQQPLVPASKLPVKNQQLSKPSNTDAKQTGTNEKSTNNLTSKVVNAEVGQTVSNRDNAFTDTTSKDQKNKSAIKPDVSATPKQQRFLSATKFENAEGGQTALNGVKASSDADKKNQKNESTANSDAANKKQRNESIVKPDVVAAAKQQPLVPASKLPVKNQQLLKPSNTGAKQTGTNEKSTNNLTSNVVNAEGGQTALNRVKASSDADKKNQKNESTANSDAANKKQRNESAAKPDVVAAAKQQSLVSASKLPVQKQQLPEARSNDLHSNYKAAVLSTSKVPVNDLQNEILTIEDESNFSTNEENKKMIQATDYGISYKKSADFDLLTEAQVQEFFKAPKADHNKKQNEESRTEISQADLDALLSKGYTKEEVVTFCRSGITPLVLKKLADPLLKFDIHQSIDCISACIKMGKTEAERAKTNQLDLVLIIGNTGVGKSTSVNYLHGCEMENKKVGHKRMIVVKEDSHLKEVVAIGHDASKTLIPSIIDSHEIGIAFCDAPGFDDSRGQEINISNAVNIRNIIENAKSIKIIILIDYETARHDRRGTRTRNILQTLNSLFGSDNSLAENESSIMIGITHAPMKTDEDEITLGDTLTEFSESMRYPKGLIERAKFLDPLNRRRPEEHCSRADWLKAINQLAPVKDHKSRFKTVLNADDVLLLIAISKEISKQVNKSLSESNYVAAAKSLEQMQYLNVIRRREIEELYQDNLRGVSNYTEAEERRIRKLSDTYAFAEAEKAVKSYLEFVLMFKEMLPSLADSFVNLINYIAEKEIECHTKRVIDAINNFSKHFDQNVALQNTLAYALHSLFNLSHPTINDTQALQHLSGYLIELRTLDKGQIGKLVEDLSNRFADLAGLANKHKNKKILTSVEETLHHELKRIAEAAWRTHRESSIKELTSINMTIHENLEKISTKIAWETNGKNILPILKVIENNVRSQDLINLFAQLAKESSIQQEAQALQSQLKKAQEIIALVRNYPAGQKDITGLPQIYKIVHEWALKIKTHLTNEQLKEEEKIRKEKEQQEVEALINKICADIENNRLDNIQGTVTNIAKLNDEQLKYIRQNKNIPYHFKEKLRIYLEELQSSINWEKNGSQILDLLNHVRSEKNSLSQEVFLKALQAIPSLNTTASLLYLLFAFFHQVKDKLGLQSTTYINIFDGALASIHKEMMKKQAEVDKLEAENKKRIQARELVTRINSILLPNNNFDELQIAIVKLTEIAPEQLETIPLKAAVDKHAAEFQDLLTAGNYDAAKNKYILLKGINKCLREILIKRNINFDLVKIEESILTHIRETISSIQKEMLDAFSKTSIGQSNSKLKSLSKLGGFFSSVNNFKVISGVNQLSDEMINTCSDVLKNSYNVFGTVNDPVIYAKLLLQTQYLTSEIGPRCAPLTLQIREVLGKTIKLRDIDFISAVSLVLESVAIDEDESSRYASEIISQYPEFKRAEVTGHRSKMNSRTAADILGELKLTSKDVLTTCYGYYVKEYDAIVNNIIANFEKPGDAAVLSSVIAKANHHGKQLLNTEIYSKHPVEIATMIANIFGVWTYLDAHSGGFKSDRTTLREPHAAQVLSVLLLLGMDTINTAIQNHFLQVKTGEGKSVITAGAAIAFALLGYQVHVACYNPWLARRDERDFSLLFKQFNFEQMIQYGDFDYHVNNKIENLGDLRGLTLKLMRGDSIQGSPAKHDKSLLFVDEVDVFFSDSFLGKTYNPSVALTNTSYTRLMIEIWDKRETYKAMKQEQFVNLILSHNLLREFLREFPNIESFMRTFCIRMHDDLISVASGNHKYEVLNQQIGYVDNVANVIRTSTFFGHATAFATIKEYQLKRVNESSLNFNTSLMPTCGHYSYAELPNSYKLIVGVTGTLFTLSEFENKLLENYGIKRKTAIPSVFQKAPFEGAEKFAVFDGDMDAEDEKGYFFNIKKAVEAAISKDRAVLLVFETEERLLHYRKYIIKHPYSIKTIKINTMLTSTMDDKRDLMVSEAASRGRVTEMIREFGRGSDFVCRDAQLRKSGGVVVISTFLSEHEAEEVQIKGRTCRQNDPGSFEMILFLDDLKKYNINTLNEIDEAQNRYTYIMQKRKEYQESKSVKIQNDLDSAKEKHEKTLKLAGLLTSHSLFSKVIPGQTADKNAQALEILRSLNNA